MDLGARAAAEIKAAAVRVDPAELEALVAGIAAARRIVFYGVGREGLMMRALAMRLYHLGIDAHVVGDMTTPPVDPVGAAGRRRRLAVRDGAGQVVGTT